MLPAARPRQTAQPSVVDCLSGQHATRAETDALRRRNRSRKYPVRASACAELTWR